MQAVEEAESLIRRVLDEIGSAGLSGTTCTPKYLMEKTKVSLDIIDSATSAFSLYNNDNSGTHIDRVHTLKKLIIKFPPAI